MPLHYLGNMNHGNCLFTDGGKLSIRRDHPHRRIEIKFCVVGGLQELVLRFEFHQNRSRGFGAVGFVICPFSLIWSLTYTKS